MKSASIFILGLIVGVGATVLITQPEGDGSTPVSRVGNHQASSDSPNWQPVDRKSRSIDYHKPMFITTQSGEEFRLYIHGSMGAPLKYEWRSTTDPLKEGGGGDLFERYEVVAEKPGGVEVRDAGGKLAIMVGKHHLEWSSKDQSSGWIYFDAAELTLSKESANKKSS